MFFRHCTCCIRSILNPTQDKTLIDSTVHIQCWTSNVDIVPHLSKGIMSKRESLIVRFQVLAFQQLYLAHREIRLRRICSSRGFLLRQALCK